MRNFREGCEIFGGGGENFVLVGVEKFSVRG